MPKSKKMCRATGHRKRDQASNTKIEGRKKKMQEQYMEEMTKRMEEYKKSLSAETENNEVVSNEQPLNIKL